MRKNKIMIFVNLYITILLSMSNMNETKPQLIYVGDPMCSWCYGMSEELSQTVSFFDDKVELQMIMGGLRAGGGEEWNSKFKDFLKHHWEDVSKRSGQPFKYDLLKRENFDYDTEPACRAVVAIEEMDKSKSLPFFKAVQKGFYYDNEDPKSKTFYKSIVGELGLDYDRFCELFDSQEVKNNTQNHFRNAGQLGVRSFPTVLLQKNGQLYMIASGYDTFDNMRSRIQKLL